MLNLFLLYFSVCFHFQRHGTVFFGLIFFIDAFFEVIYTLFPLLFLTDAKSIFDLRSLGLLRQTNAFFTIQALIALIFLGHKCQYLMSELDPSYIEDYQFKQLNKIKMGQYFDQKPWIITKHWIKYSKTVSKNDSNLTVAAARARVLPFNDKLTSLLRNGLQIDYTLQTTPMSLSSPQHFPNTANVYNTRDPVGTATNSTTITNIPEPDETRNDQISNENDATGMQSIDSDSVKNILDEYNADNKQQTLRKLIVFMIGLLFFGVGMSILISFVVDIEYNYKNKCLISETDLDVSKNEWFVNNPEISEFYQTKCLFQVVKIFDDYPCNCREFSDTLYHSERNNMTVLRRVFEKWDMLEAIVLHAGTSPETNEIQVNFTSASLPHLRIFYIKHHNIGYFSDIVETWKSLG